MSLPGKLCVGILEEDNPLKSYFRFKPLLIEEDGKYAPYKNGQLYPEEGCIRIVPDKNESSHFKARMRQIGLFSIVDLSEHPNENDKIRPNKNYHGDGEEQNAFIIYSDVVREPMPNMIFQTFTIGEEGTIPEILPFIPNTAKLLARTSDGLMNVCYGWEAMNEDENQARLMEIGEVCDVSEMQIFDIPGFRDERLSFAILPSACLEQIPDIPSEKSAFIADAPSGSSSQTEMPTSVSNTGEEKPWISRNTNLTPQPVDSRLSPLQKILAEQVGLNPRRGRSLQELIDEKWQRSRMNQLGHPVDVVTEAPINSPVELATEAVRSAWKNHNMRQPLLEALAHIEEFGISMQECREILRKSTIEQQLNTLEARRLELMGEMEHLRQGRENLRAQLKQEIRRDEAAALSDALQKTEAAKVRQYQYEKQAEEAREAAESAQKVLDALANGELEKRLHDFAMNSHILERIERDKALSASLNNALSPQKINLEDFIQRTGALFAGEGWQTDRKFIVNLCVCAMLSPMIIFSGAAGSGKTRAAQLLAEALGWTGTNRCAAFPPGEISLIDNARIVSLAASPNDPAMILLDDANLQCGADLLRGLSLLSQSPEWRICLTLQDADAGNPVSANLFDQGFTIRLSCPDSSVPWQPNQKTPAAPMPPVSLHTVRESTIAMVSDNVSPEVIERMSVLRRKLSEYGVVLSRRALDDSWNYCGLMSALMKEDITAREIFDLAVCQRILPTLLSAAPLELLARLPEILKELPACQAFLNEPLPIQI